MQNPPPTQPGYGGYGGPPQPSRFAHLGRSALGNMEANAAGALAYIGIVGLILIIIEKENRFVRFHAMQSLLYGVGMGALLGVLLIVVWIFSLVLVMIGAAMGSSGGGALAAIAALIAMIVWIAAITLVPLLILGGLIFGAIKAYNGEMYRLPIVGALAEKLTK
jgi:uncharacterized membrane protein